MANRIPFIAEAQERARGLSPTPAQLEGGSSAGPEVRFSNYLTTPPPKRNGKKKTGGASTGLTGSPEVRDTRDGCLPGGGRPSARTSRHRHVGLREPPRSGTAPQCRGRCGRRARRGAGRGGGEGPGTPSPPRGPCGAAPGPGRGRGRRSGAGPGGSRRAGGRVPATAPRAAGRVEERRVFAPRCSGTCPRRSGKGA